MEFYEVINTRRSIRQFEDREISREVLERILDAGLNAPSWDHYRQLGIEVTFELSPGNHFQDAALRSAKGMIAI